MCGQQHGIVPARVIVVTVWLQVMNGAEAPLIIAQGLSGKVGELQKKKSEEEKKQQQQHSDDDDGSWDAVMGSGSGTTPGGLRIVQHYATFE